MSGPLHMPPLAAPGHHGQEHYIRTKATIPKGLQLALVANIVANGPPEPPGAKHWPANTTEQTPEHRRAAGAKHNANHRPLARAIANPIHGVT